MPLLFVLATVEHFLQLAFAEKEFVDTDNVSDILANNSSLPPPLSSFPPLAVGNWQLSQAASKRALCPFLLTACICFDEQRSCSSCCCSWSKVRTSFLPALIRQIWPAIACLHSGTFQWTAQRFMARIDFIDGHPRGLHCLPFPSFSPTATALLNKSKATRATRAIKTNWIARFNDVTDTCSGRDM